MMKCFLDFEFTLPQEDIEVLSIGLVLVNDGYEVIDTFYCLINPMVELPDGYKKIPKAEWNRAVAFTEAHQLLDAWLKNHQIQVIYCFGGYDEYVFGKTCLKYGVLNILEKQLVDAQPMLARVLNYPQIPSLVGLKKQLGSDQLKQMHHALVDAYDLMLVFEKIYFPKRKRFGQNPIYEQVKSEIAVERQLIVQEYLIKHSKKTDRLRDKKLPFPYQAHYSEVLDSSGWRIVCALDNAKLENFKEDDTQVMNVFYYPENPETNYSRIIFEYWQENSLLLKGVLISDRKEWQVVYDQLTEAGQFLLNSGVVFVQAQVFMSRLRASIFYHEVQGRVLRCCLSVRTFYQADLVELVDDLVFEKGVGLVVPFFKDGKLVQVDILIMDKTLTVQLDFQSFVLQSNIEAMSIQIFQLLKRYPNVRFYSHREDEVRAYLVGGEGMRLYEFTKFCRRLQVVLNLEESLCPIQGIQLLNEVLGLKDENYAEEFSELVSFLNVFRYSRGFVAKEGIVSVIENLELKVQPLQLSSDFLKLKKSC